MRRHARQRTAYAFAGILLPLQGGGGEGDGVSSLVEETHPNPNPTARRWHAARVRQAQRMRCETPGSPLEGEETVVRGRV